MTTSVSPISLLKAGLQKSAVEQLSCLADERLLLQCSESRLHAGSCIFVDQVF